MGKEWGNVRITKELLQEAEELLTSPKFKKMGFNGVSSLVAYLIRREIDRYSK